MTSSFYQQNGKVITVLSATEKNKVDHYVRARLCKKYLRFCSNRFPDGYKEKSAPTRALMKACGYGPNKIDKFRSHREAWLHLARPIPFRFLHAIGAKRSTLEHCMRRDQVEYDKYSARVVYPRAHSIRYGPCVYGSRPLPEGTTEAEAIQIMIATAAELGRHCWLKIDGLRGTFAWPETPCKKNDPSSIDVRTYYYRPELIRKKHELSISDDDSYIGSVRLR